MTWAQWAQSSYNTDGFSVTYNCARDVYTIGKDNKTLNGCGGGETPIPSSTSAIENGSSYSLDKCSEPC